MSSSIDSMVRNSVTIRPFRRTCKRGGARREIGFYDTCMLMERVNSCSCAERRLLRMRMPGCRPQLTSSLCHRRPRWQASPNLTSTSPGSSRPSAGPPGTTDSTTSMPVLPGCSRSTPGVGGGKKQLVARTNGCMPSSCYMHGLMPARQPYLAHPRVAHAAVRGRLRAHWHCRAAGAYSRRPLAAWTRAPPPRSPAAGPAAAPAGRGGATEAVKGLAAGVPRAWLAAPSRCPPLPQLQAACCPPRVLPRTSGALQLWEHRRGDACMAGRRLPRHSP